MTAEMWLIAAVRLLGSLPVLRWPFYGGLAAVLVDQSDLFLMNLIHLGGVDDYQSFDKYLDQAYLLAFLVVALRWPPAPRAVSGGLYAYRMAGFVAFEATGKRWLLLLFPNFFEFWFLLVAADREFRLRARLRPAQVNGLLSGLVALKLFQEYAIHYQRWLDGFTAVEAVQAVWRWLTPF
jgi:hypothetical protein